MLVGKISVDKLKEHPKNNYYFTDIEGEKYEEIKRSIATYGIRDPLKVTTSYTVISGHQRLRIAKDLGMKEVPVEILDVDEREAEYLLIAENVERRGQAESDPIKKARIAQFLKEYWGVRDGSANPKGTKIGEGQNAFTKKVSDIAETIGETERTTKRILKLNDLIPQLQKLVSSGKLGTTAAEQLAYLTPEVQSALYDALGEEIGERTVAEIKRIRKEYENKPPKEVIIDKTDYETIDRLKKELAQKEKQRELLERKLREQEKDIAEVQRIKKELADLTKQRDDIERQIDSALTLSSLYVEIENFLQTKLAPIKYSRAILERRDSKVVMENLSGIITAVENWCKEMRSYLPNENYIDAEVIVDE